MTGMKQNEVPFTPLEWPRRLLVLAFVVASVWYLHWRYGTLNPEAPVFSGLIYGAEVFGFATALLHVFMCWRLTERKAPPARLDVTVDVFVPTYNESVDLVRKTLLAARGMDHPHTTWLLDDGRRPEMKALAAQLGCEYLARDDNEHAKAGNLNHALRHSRGELIAIFDADHAPRQDFLAKTLGYFENRKVAFVQTPQDFYNLDSYQHRPGGAGRTVWTEQSLFFRVIQRGKDYWNAAFFCGSCAVIRRSALEDIGGFATGTVTEDLHTSMRIHAKGHQSVYHAEPLAFGLAPESIQPFLAQRVRWGQGAMHVWRKEGILTHRGLSLAQRLNYFASVLTYFDGWQKAIFYFAPVLVLLSGVLPMRASMTDFLIHFAPFCLLTFWVFEEVARGYGRSLFIEQYNMARFAAFAWATLAWIVPPMKFKVTAKGMPAARAAMRLTFPQWSVLALNALAIVVGGIVWLVAPNLPVGAVVASMFWAIVNSALGIGVIAFTTITQRNRRTQYRFPVAVPAELVMADGTRVRGTVDDVSENGLRFYGRLPVTLAVGDALTGHLTVPEGPVAFWGEVRGAVPMAGGEPGLKALGLHFSTSAEGRDRLEGFLFGSDLQWVLNGYTDQVHTPMSRWLPGIVPGPGPNPLVNVRWNAGLVRVERDGPAEPVLLSAEGSTGGEAYIVSHHALPEQRDLILDVSRRIDAPARAVRLAPLALSGPGGSDVAVCAYRIVSSTELAPAGASSLSESLERGDFVRRRDAQPSTY
ncbi:cellulose synthase (UDP-forming) OS=Rhizobacter sp. Root404 OX=1736528 GN=ASC76_12450 PE=4 SV=1 [Rhizobacter fulvus]